MQPPDALIKQGILELPTLGDGRQSGTSGSPSILNVSPESAVGGGLALLKTGDNQDRLNQGSLDVMLDESEWISAGTPLNPSRLNTRPLAGDLPGNRGTIFPGGRDHQTCGKIQKNPQHHPPAFPLNLLINSVGARGLSQPLWRNVFITGGPSGFGESLVEAFSGSTQGLHSLICPGCSQGLQNA
ncbi:MAG: hypothetical protein Ct9H90mP9_5640 [Pseudomonadota bacterium]|nr:MAG: hypothetical protein Ct9H90mP9_5640 [Pseudomonadota bacterium]